MFTCRGVSWKMIDLFAFAAIKKRKPTVLQRWFIISSFSNEDRAVSTPEQPHKKCKKFHLRSAPQSLAFASDAPRWGREKVVARGRTRLFPPRHRIDFNAPSRHRKIVRNRLHFFLRCKRKEKSWAVQATNLFHHYQVSFVPPIYNALQVLTGCLGVWSAEAIGTEAIFRCWIIKV